MLSLRHFTRAASRSHAQAAPFLKGGALRWVRTSAQQGRLGGSETPPRASAAAAAAAVGGLALSGKGKAVAAAVMTAGKAFKMKSAVTMAASIGVYGYFWGLPYAAGFVGCMAVHEMGHAAALRYYKIPTSGVTFIPFVGATITMKGGRHLTQWQDAVIAIAGPVAGAAAGTAALGGGLAAHSAVAVAVGKSAFLMNAFNLLPIGSLDGSYILGLLSRNAQVLGAASLVFLTSQGLIQPHMTVILLAMAAMHAVRTNSSPLPLGCSQQQRFMMAASYVTLLAFLLVMYSVADEILKPITRRLAKKEGGLVQELV